MIILAVRVSNLLPTITLSALLLMSSPAHAMVSRAVRPSNKTMLIAALSPQKDALLVAIKSGHYSLTKSLLHTSAKRADRSAVALVQSKVMIMQKELTEQHDSHATLKKSLALLEKKVAQLDKKQTLLIAQNSALTQDLNRATSDMETVRTIAAKTYGDALYIGGAAGLICGGLYQIIFIK